MKILLIEDDPIIIEAIEFAFQTGWQQVEMISANWGQEGIDMVENESPDVVLLDLGLPDINGIDVLKQIRSFSDVPIVVLTVNQDEITLVQALGLGANDYVYKPFRPMELIARVKRLVLQHTAAGASSPLIWGPFVLDPNKRELSYKDTRISLRGIESIILKELFSNYPKVVTYNQLARAAWGDNYAGANDCLKVHVYNLRKKLEGFAGIPRIIMNKSGVGYYALPVE